MSCNVVNSTWFVAHVRLLGIPKGEQFQNAANIGTLTYGRGPPGPVVNGVLRTPDGVVNLRPKAMLRLRKATGLLNKVARTRTALTVAAKPIDGSKIENLAATEPSMTDGTSV